MISGAHAIIYSTNPEADRAFLRDILALPHVEVGHGWLIFGLPPSEVAVHPGGQNNVHELYFMCDDIQAFVTRMKAHAIDCDAVKDEGWGLLTHLTLPGGGRIGVYQPRHARPPASAGPCVVRSAPTHRGIDRTAAPCDRAYAAARSRLPVARRRVRQHGSIACSLER